MLVVSEKEESLDTANVSVVSFKEVTMATPTFNSHHPNQSAAIKTHALPAPRNQPNDYGSLNFQIFVSKFQQSSVFN